MRAQLRLVVALSVIVIACQARCASSTSDTAQVQPPADSPATATVAREPKSGDSTTVTANGVDPRTTPAKPTPTVTSENAIATMRQQLQRLETRSAADLQAGMTEHTKAVNDLFTTMRVEVQDVSSPAKNAW